MKHIYCPTCKNAIEQTSEECCYCGTKFFPCPQCGKTYVGEFLKCPICGEKIKQPVDDVSLKEKTAKSLESGEEISIKKRADSLKIAHVCKSITILIIFFVCAAFPIGYMDSVPCESVYDILVKLVSNFDIILSMDRYGKLFWVSFLLFGVLSYDLYSSSIEAPTRDKKMRNIRLVIHFTLTVLIGVIGIWLANDVFVLYNISGGYIIPLFVLSCVSELLVLIDRQIIFRDKGDKGFGTSALSWLLVASCMISIFANPCMSACANFGTIFSLSKDVTVVGKIINNELGDNVYLFEKFKEEDFNGESYLYYYYNVGYEYWKNRTIELKQELEEIQENLSEEEALDETLARAETLMREIAIIQRYLDDLQNEYVMVRTYQYLNNRGTYRSEIVEIVYNACENNMKKWDNKTNKKLFSNQSITLTQTEFEKGTDFSSIKLGATIRYYDGSLKKSYITISNVTALNGADKGMHIIQWSDSWGNYEYEIQII